MADITSLAEMKTWILTELGHPVITVELHDSHLQHAIDEAVNAFTRYNYGEGNGKDFLALSLSANVANYDLSGSGINNVIDIIMSVGGSGNINMLFTPTNMILSPADFVKLTNFQIVDWHMAMMKLSEINEYFTVRFRGEYNPTSQSLKVIPTPTENMNVMMEVYKKSTALNLYNNYLVKRLALAKAMMIWGRILRKYTINLPGGGTIDGASLLADGKELEAEVMPLIQGEGETTNSLFFVA